MSAVAVPAAPPARFSRASVRGPSLTPVARAVALCTALSFGLAAPGLASAQGVLASQYEQQPTTQVAQAAPAAAVPGASTSAVPSSALPAATPLSPTAPATAPGMPGRPAVQPQSPSTPQPSIPMPQPVAPASSAPPQSLLELYELARNFDATYLSVRAETESAIYRSAQADALNLPVATLSAGITRTEIDPPSIGRRSSNNQDVTVQGRQPLYNRSNKATIEQAHRSLDVSRAQLDLAEQDLIIRVGQAYFDVLAAQDAVATNLANKTAITEQLAAARRNFEVGTATITDTREAQARFDLATAQQIAAENDLLSRRIALDTLVGRKGVNPQQIAQPLAVPALAPANVEAWATLAYANHPTIRRAQLAYDIAQLEVDKSRAQLYPTIDLVGSAGPSRSTGSALTGNNLPGTTTSASVGVQLNMTLFSGFAQQNRIRETELLVTQSEQDLEAARRSVDQATRQAYYALQSSRAQVSALEAAESSSQLALEATQVGYRVGVRVNLDVLNAQTQLYTTQQNLASARYTLLLGTLRLRQAAGTLAPGDVQSVNFLLAH